MQNVSKYVLDASAALALLNNEPGAQRIKEILPDSVIGAVNVCETVGKLMSAGMSAADAQSSIELLSLEVISFDINMAYNAAALIVKTKKLGLSLGDRACLALGIMHNKTVVTAERLWSKLNIEVNIELIRGSVPRE